MMWEKDGKIVRQRDRHMPNHTQQEGTTNIRRDTSWAARVSQSGLYCTWPAVGLGYGLPSIITYYASDGYRSG